MTVASPASILLAVFLTTVTRTPQGARHTNFDGTLSIGATHDLTATGTSKHGSADDIERGVPRAEPDGRLQFSAPGSMLPAMGPPQQPKKTPQPEPKAKLPELRKPLMTWFSESPRQKHRWPDPFYPEKLPPETANQEFWADLLRGNGSQLVAADGKENEWQKSARFWSQRKEILHEVMLGVAARDALEKMTSVYVKLVTARWPLVDQITETQASLAARDAVDKELKAQIETELEDARERKSQLETQMGILMEEMHQVQATLQQLNEAKEAVRSQIVELTNTQKEVASYGEALAVLAQEADGTVPVSTSEALKVLSDENGELFQEAENLGFVSLLKAARERVSELEADMAQRTQPSLLQAQIDMQETLRKALERLVRAETLLDFEARRAAGPDRSEHLIQGYDKLRGYDRTLGYNKLRGYDRSKFVATDGHDKLRGYERLLERKRQFERKQEDIRRASKRQSED